MSSYYQESNTSAIYREFVFRVSLGDNYNTIKTYPNFNNQTPLPTYNSKVINETKLIEKKPPLKLPMIIPY